MGLSVRIASFNFENFFSRPTLLNRDNATVAPLLTDLAELETDLARPVYDAATKARILENWKKLSKYLTLRENKGKLFSGSGAKRKVSAVGAGSWAGSVEMKRESIPDEGQENTLRVVAAVDADILCTVEMDDRYTLRHVATSPRLPKPTRFSSAMLIDGNDDRGIDVGVLSKAPITELRSHVDDRDADGVVFSRDCLEAKVELPNGHDVHVLANHFKSQGYGSQAGNDAKRLRQSERVAEILRRHDLENEYVVVAGDLNADRDAPNASSLGPLLSHPHLVDVLRVDLGAGDDWAYYYGGKKQRLDYLFCSTALASRLDRTRIERRGMWNLAKITQGAETPFPQVTGATTAASDHAAIVAEFDLP